MFENVIQEGIGVNVELKNNIVNETKAQCNNLRNGNAFWVRLNFRWVQTNKRKKRDFPEIIWYNIRTEMTGFMPELTDSIKPGGRGNRPPGLQSNNFYQIFDTTSECLGK